MNVLSDLTKGDGCGPQQSAVGGLSTQLLRARFLQQQQQQQHSTTATAQWHSVVQQAMHANSIGANPMDARFQHGPAMQRNLTVPAPMNPALSMPNQLNMPNQQRSMSAPVMSMREAWQMRAEAGQRQQQHHLLQMQQQQMMMQRQQMMMMQQARMMPQANLLVPPPVHVPAQQHMPVSPIDVQDSATQETPAVEDTAEPVTETESDADRLLKSEAFRRMEEAWRSEEKGRQQNVDELWKDLMAMHAEEMAQDSLYGTPQCVMFVSSGRRLGSAFDHCCYCLFQVQI